MIMKRYGFKDTGDGFADRVLDWLTNLPEALFWVMIVLWVAILMMGMW